MLDLDKSLDFSCPEECGQIAVSCTLRDILEGRPLVCASCGTEFHPADHPGWLKQAGHLAFQPADKKLHKAMQSLADYLYHGGKTPPADVLGVLLTVRPDDWRKFRNAALPVFTILELKARYPEFTAEYDFSRLDADAWTELLMQDRSFAEFCTDWSVFRTEQLKTPGFLDRYADRLSRQQLLELLGAEPALYPKMKNVLSPSLLDRICFRHYGITAFYGKAAAFRMFWVQVSVFAAGWFCLLPGEAGFRAFRAEHPKMAQTAFIVYIVFGLFWSWCLSVLHQYCGAPAPRSAPSGDQRKGSRLTVFLGLVHGTVGVLLFRHTYFLTSVNRPDFWRVVAVYAVYLLIVYCIRWNTARKISEDR